MDTIENLKTAKGKFESINTIGDTITLIEELKKELLIKDDFDVLDEMTSVINELDLAIESLNTTSTNINNAINACNSKITQLEKEKNDEESHEEE